MGRSSRRQGPPGRPATKQPRLRREVPIPTAPPMRCCATTRWAVPTPCPREATDAAPPRLQESAPLTTRAARRCAAALAGQSDAAGRASPRTARGPQRPARPCPPQRATAAPTRWPSQGQSGGEAPPRPRGRSRSLPAAGQARLSTGAPRCAPPPERSRSRSRRRRLRRGAPRHPRRRCKRPCPSPSPLAPRPRPKPPAATRRSR
mmetsp:Transcript_8197/g.32303  ORF Transcript_8197/g.32303 Transcript_8197/m.32303 type:complete len:205 (+) Transcript_8197:2194-2808(+)